MSKTIAYIRISSNKQDTENQKHKILAYAQENKIMIDEFLEIELTSKSKREDRKVTELINKLEKGNKLLVTELSRLGRDMMEILNTVTDITQKGILTTFINQPQLSTTGNKLADNILLAVWSAMAESERDEISNRTKQALQRLKDNGVKLGHKKLFLKSKYDEYEEAIYSFRENAKLSFEKICLLLDPNKDLGFKQQSLRTWFNKRYDIDTFTHTLQKTKEYKKYCEDKQNV